MKFKDKVVWITGAASGIGEALAYQSTEYGAKVILSDIDEPRLRQVAGKCESMNGEVLSLPLDHSNFEYYLRLTSSNPMARSPRPIYLSRPFLLRQ